MKAWEIADRLFRSAIPVVRDESEQTWDTSESVAAHDARLLRFWDSRVPGSGAPESLMVAAFQSLENKGFRTGPHSALLDEGLRAVASGDLERLQVIDARLRALWLTAVPDPSHPSRRTRRFASWAEFDAEVDWPADMPVDVAGGDFAARVEAGWRGQLVGAAVGTAIEGYSAERLAAAFGPIDRYVRPPNTFNDDITFELAFLDAFETNGPAVTSADIAERWLAMIPEAWSAEAIALDNLRRGLFPPESARFANPFDEWIGAQMRGAICGMVAPGRPREAARLAWLDAAISHTGNGVLGEVFNAVLTAAAFCQSDIRSILVQTIALFPETTEFGAVLRFALRAAGGAADWRAAWRACDEKFVEYNWIHAYPNAAAEVVAMWCGAGDFDTTLAVVGGIGHDADCNAAQILGVLAIAHGPDAVAGRWIEPLGDTVRTTMRRPARLSFRELVDWTIRAVRRHA